MNTFLFVAKPKFHPERVTRNKRYNWSCQKDARIGDAVYVYVTAVGIAYEWRVESDAAPSDDWPYTCDVSLIGRIDPPIPFPELRRVIKPGKWSALDQRFRGISSRLLKPPIDSIIRDLARSPRESAQDMGKAFEDSVKKASRLTVAERRRRLAKAPRRPEQRQTTATVFIRNPVVVAEVLHRAKGKCEACREPAPFMRKSDKTPYLEVHHKKRLIDGGHDTVENAIALCPNCHRKAHFG